MKIRVPPYANMLDYYWFLKGSAPIDTLRRHVIIRVMGVKYRRLKSSSLQSLERGRPTEVDSFNGYVARAAAEHGVEAPLNQRLTRIVHEIESGTRRIGPHNFDAPAGDGKA
jgi:2-dehydropantoate 2-reductase